MINSADLTNITKQRPVKELKYKPRRDIPEFARDYQTVSPSKIARIASMNSGRDISPSSVSLWFYRHPDIHDRLSKDIGKGSPPKNADSTSSIAP